MTKLIIFFAGSSNMTETCYHLQILDPSKASVYDTVVFEGPPMTEQTLWPRHCVQDTWGAELHKDLKVTLVVLPLQSPLLCLINTDCSVSWRKLPFSVPISSFYPLMITTECLHVQISIQFGRSGRNRQGIKSVLTLCRQSQWVLIRGLLAQTNNIAFLSSAKALNFFARV